mgnify:CR=1 FL=1
MSGGVDSSVAAALLKQQGHEVIGLHLKLYHGAEQDSRPKSCCSLDEAMEEELDLPGWDAAYVEMLTELYDEDVCQIGQMPGVTLIEP